MEFGNWGQSFMKATSICAAHNLWKFKTNYWCLAHNEANTICTVTQTLSLPTTISDCACWCHCHKSLAPFFWLLSPFGERRCESLASENRAVLATWPRKFPCLSFKATHYSKIINQQFYLGSINSYDVLVKKYRESQAQLKKDSRRALTTTKSTTQFFSVRNHIFK